MKLIAVLSTIAIIATAYGSLQAGELIDVSPTGDKYHDPYSKQYTPGNHSLNLDSGLSQFKSCFSGLSKKKTSDVVIYPTPRG